MRIYNLIQQLPFELYLLIHLAKLIFLPQNSGNNDDNGDDDKYEHIIIRCIRYRLIS